MTAVGTATANQCKSNGLVAAAQRAVDFFCFEKLLWLENKPLKSAKIAATADKAIVDLSPVSNQALFGHSQPLSTSKFGHTNGTRQRSPPACVTASSNCGS
jgi:hypothetical protein